MKLLRHTRQHKRRRLQLTWLAYEEDVLQTISCSFLH